MLHRHVGWFSAHDIENLNHLWVRWVNDRKNIRAERDMSLIEELYSQSLALWRGNEFTLIGVHIEVLACIDECEVLGTLDDEENNIFYVKDKWGTPVHGTVDIALSGGAHDEVVVLHAHVDHSFSEIEIVIHLVKAVVDADPVFRIQNSFDVSPLKGSVNDMAEHNLAISASS